MIPLDKIIHLLGGMVITLMLGYFLPISYCLIAAVVAGAAKELYDHFNPATHTVEMHDFLATAGGGFLASIFLVIVQEVVV